MLNLEENPASDHIREMARYFNAVLDEGSDASTITMDNDKAKGFVSSYRLFNGLTVWVYNINFQKDFEVDLGLSEDRPYYFCYNVKGHFFHRFGEQETFTKILQNQNMIVRGSPGSSVQIRFPTDTKLEIAVIVADLNILGSLDIRNAKRMHSEMEQIFGNIPYDRTYRHLGDIDVETGKYASIICEKNDVDLVSSLLTEGAVLNMLANQLKAYTQDSINKDPQLKLNKSELSLITSLGEHIVEHLEENITIQELSTTFGMSPKKLQAGVKHLYGNTVGHYILNLRMGHAKQLFLTTEFNVSEVCHKVGLSSQSYFAKVFKDRYAISPSVYRRNVASKRS